MSVYNYRNLTYDTCSRTHGTNIGKLLVYNYRILTFGSCIACILKARKIDQRFPLTTVVSQDRIVVNGKMWVDLAGFLNVQLS